MRETNLRNLEKCLIMLLLPQAIEYIHRDGNEAIAETGDFIAWWNATDGNILFVDKESGLIAHNVLGLKDRSRAIAKANKILGGK